ncbi:hypothetical protein [Microseira wollei]|uniref:Transposase n=1 Tax=Microseira wollei NIES-4236 TaxID=2530354 RepID=A0AAV3XST4_9CYAN|nr:hypothetical protein [Microseira wollei]GET42972.1 hypothetical protein MicvaDRAFT_3049 [Microseira wollei NIES-4236]
MQRIPRDLTTEGKLATAQGRTAANYWGGKELDRVGGSDLCRMALWQWVLTRREVKRKRPQNDIGEQLGNLLDGEKSAGRPLKLVRTPVAAPGAKLLFKRLVSELKND